MYQDMEDCFYYLTVYNENYVRHAMRSSVSMSECM